MKKILALVTAVTLALGVSSGAVMADSSAAKVRLTLGATPTTSPMYAYYVGVANSISGFYPEFEFTVTETQGLQDIENRLRVGLVDLGNCNNDMDYESYNGTGDYEGQPRDDFRVLWYYSAGFAQWMVTKDSGVKEFSDLQGKKFSAGSTGSGVWAMTNRFCDLFGIEPNWFEATQSDAADAIANRQIIGTSKLGPAPDSYLMQVAASADCDLVTMTQEQVDQIGETWPFYIPATIPAGTYEGQDEDILTVSTVGGCKTTTAISQEVGYKLFKGFWEGNKSEWQAAYPTGADVDIPELTLATAQTPLHAGTVQYLKELGYEVPEELIPPEYVEPYNKSGAGAARHSQKQSCAVPLKWILKNTLPC